ncbi:MAG: DUF6174 domain-containing protein [Treponema sp.]|nr:DUF6174 domain-containing protein [Treponema sp.]
MKKILLAAMASALLYACSGSLAPRLVFDAAAFAKAQANWAALGIADYSFEVEEFSRGPKPPIFRVTVVNGDISDIALHDDRYDKDTFYTDAQLARDLKSIREIGTIPAIFDLIETMRADDERKLPLLRDGESITLRVAYNGEYGFPEEVSSYISSILPDPIISNSYHLKISNFRPISK